MGKKSISKTELTNLVAEFLKTKEITKIPASHLKKDRPQTFRKMSVKG